MQFSVSIKLLSVRGLQSLGCAGQANYRPIVNLCFTHSLLCEHWLGVEKRLFPWFVIYSVCPLRQLMLRLAATAQRLTKNKRMCGGKTFLLDRKSTRLNSSHVAISYAVFCLKKKK